MGWVRQRAAGIAVAWVACLLALVPFVGAEIPKVINYQGLLTDMETGEPMTGTVDITISLYDLADCDAETPSPLSLWSELHSSVPVNNGTFEVPLGSIEPFDNAGLAFDQPYCLGVAVGGTEMMPRNTLTGAPFTFRSEMVEGVVDNALTGASFQLGTIDGNKFADGSIDPVKLSQSCA